MDNNYRDILSFTFEELEKYITDAGQPAFRAKQIYAWLHKKLAAGWDDMSNVPKKLREMLSADYDIQPLGVVEKLTSGIDGTSKYLMASYDGGIIESVAMKYNYGMSVCISSQIGCRMGCRFCASTLLGLERNLTASEMLSQVYNIQRDTGERVGNIVIMGIGEPFDNYDEVMKFIRMVSDADGLNISQRNITVSTCGLADRIYDFADEGFAVTLAISLHAPNDSIRKEIMPVAARYGIGDIMEACRYFIMRTGRRVTFEYTMINGVNDSTECASELVSLLRGMLCHVNLIALNSVKERDCRSSGIRNIRCFEKYLQENGINATIRRGMGKDIDAACGQLRKRYLKS